MKEQKLNVDDLLLEQGFRKWSLGIDDDETLFWEMLKEEHPQYKETMSQAQLIIRTAEEELPLIDEETNNKMLSRLKEKLGWNKQQKVKKINRFSYVYLKVAAAVALIVVSALAVFNNGYNSEKAKNEELAIQLIEKSTPSGSKLNFYLDDGTHVVLNSESKIRFNRTLATDNKRDVYLEGEAYFDVAKDKKRPFTVFTGDFSTTASGTEFNINANPQNDQVEIALVEGSVLVKDSKSNQDVILNPGIKVLAYKSDKGFVREVFDVKKTTSWKEGIIYLNDTDFDESIKVLERWYGVDFKIENRPKQVLTCSGVFEKDNLSNVLKSIGFALKFNFEIENKNVLIEFNE